MTKVMSWNVNSINARLELLCEYLDEHHPDIVCLQELKCEDSRFPEARLRDMGYRSFSFGQKRYNGVAILSKVEPQKVLRGFERF